MNLIRQWTGVNQPLMFRDDVLSVSGRIHFVEPEPIAASINFSEP
jgi:hypothetical protein